MNWNWKFECWMVHCLGKLMPFFMYNSHATWCCLITHYLWYSFHLKDYKMFNLFVCLPFGNYKNRFLCLKLKIYWLLLTFHYIIHLYILFLFFFLNFVVCCMNIMTCTTYGGGCYHWELHPTYLIIYFFDHFNFLFLFIIY